MHYINYIESNLECNHSHWRRGQLVDISLTVLWQFWTVLISGFLDSSVVLLESSRRFDSSWIRELVSSCCSRLRFTVWYTGSVYEWFSTGDDSVILLIYLDTGRCFFFSTPDISRGDFVDWDTGLSVDFFSTGYSGWVTFDFVVGHCSYWPGCHSTTQFILCILVVWLYIVSNGETYRYSERVD